jgi:hypothetical protein
MTVGLRQTIEKTIVMEAVKCLIQAGYSISINNGGDEDEISPTQEITTIESALFATDDEYILAIKAHKLVGWIHAVYGSDGYDVISDYTTNLESALAGANALADKICEGSTTTGGASRQQVVPLKRPD